MGLDQIIQAFFAIILFMVLFEWMDLTGALILLLGGILLVQPFGPFDPAWGY